MLKAKLLAGGGAETIYVDDVFSAYTRTGTGASQVTTTNIDMTQGYMLWSKGRSGATDHAIYDSARGVTKDLVSNTTAAETTQSQGLTAVSATGHTFGTLAKVNTNAATYVDWVFRKAPKFFDVVTYTGTGTAGLTVSHSLGIKPGMIIVKRTDTTGNWAVYHQSIAAANGLQLETTSASFAASYWNSTEPTASQFTLGAPATAVNASGGTYVAYLFAHDTGTDGIVQCGSFTVASNIAAVTLGWEPQFLLVKQASGAGGDWRITDVSRAFSRTKNLYLVPNTSAADSNSGLADGMTPTATGFYTNGFFGDGDYIYLAIRRPNKPPTLGTQVYQAIARTGTGAAATVTGVGFAPDLVALHSRSAATGGRWEDRLRGATTELVTETTAAETTVAQSVTSFGMDGVALGTDGDWNTNTATYINWFFKRAPGVFDQVCYTGTGVAKTEAHSLGVVPELMIVKQRLGGVDDWTVYHSVTGNTKYLVMNTNAAAATFAMWDNTSPTSSVFSIGSSSQVNESPYAFVWYGFATKAGISKVGSYTGTATTNAIDCGFTTGARFVLIKRTDSTGDWYVWDTVRGIIAGNDPYLLLNSTAAETTSTDYIDPSTAGFELSSTAPAAINASGGTFIYLAFA